MAAARRLHIYCSGSQYSHEEEHARRITAVVLHSLDGLANGKILILFRLWIWSRVLKLCTFR
jgi:hypothetical protein